MTTKIITASTFQTFAAEVKVTIPFCGIASHPPFAFEFQKQIENMQFDCPFVSETVEINAISPLGFDEAANEWIMIFRVTYFSKAKEI